MTTNTFNTSCFHQQCNEHYNILQTVMFKSLFDITDNNEKGYLAEDIVQKYMKNWFKDIDNCGHIYYSCDLFSNLHKVRVEIKCRSKTKGLGGLLKQFHRDCKLNENNTNIFVFIDICQDSNLNTCVRRNPIRYYINGRDLNSKLMNEIKHEAELMLV